MSIGFQRFQPQRITGKEIKVEEFLTVEQVADLLKCSESTVRNLVRDGLPHVRFPRGGIRFRARDVHKWADMYLVSEKGALL